MVDYPPATQQVHARYGVTHVHSHADLISDSIRLYGEWAQDEINLMVRFLKPGDVVLDIGSCMGTHAIAFADVVGPTGAVHSFEPDPDNFLVLAANAGVAGRETIHPRNVAVSSLAGRAELVYEAGNVGAAHLLAAGEQLSANASVSVKTVTLDGEVWDRIDLIKIDVEGHEPDVLAGAVETLRQHRPALYIEVNTLDAGTRCLKWLKDLNYSVFGHVSYPFNCDNFLGYSDDIYNGGRECGFLCIHQDQIDDWQQILSASDVMSISVVDDIVRLLIHKPQYWHDELGQLAEQIGITRNSELTVLHEDNDARGRELVRLRGVLAELEANLAKAESAGATYRSELTDLHGDNDARERELVRLRGVLAELEANLAEAESAGATYRSVLKLTESGLEAATSELQLAKDREWSLQARVRRQDQALQQGQDQLREAAAQLTRATREMQIQIDERNHVIAGYVLKLQTMDSLVKMHRSSLELLELFGEEWSSAMKVVRRARAFPSSLYFKLHTRYRRLTRSLIKTSPELRGRLESQRHEILALIDATAAAQDAQPLTAQTEAAESNPALDPADLQLCAEHFDATYYKRHNMDVARAEIDPFEHFMATGWRESRNPNSWFDTDYYLTMRPNLLESDFNPFLHYLKHGRHEGVLPAHPGGYRALMLAETAGLKPVRYPKVPPDVLDIEALVTRLRPALAVADNRMQMSFTHSEWLDSIGGTEVCMQIEARACADAGIVHLSIYPVVQPYRLAAPATVEAITLGLSLDGERIGTSNYDTIGDAIAQITAEGARIETTIHHILGHQTEGVSAVIEATGRRHARYYLHDYVTICGQWNLLQNDILFCGGPKVDSGACSICRYGADRALHLERVSRLFEAIEMTIISPSEAALAVWRTSSKLPVADIMVLPHIVLTTEPRRKLRIRVAEAPMRIGFVGAQAYNKGWEEFKALVDAYADDNRFRFHYFGTAEPALDVEFHKATVTSVDRAAMASAIEQADMDLILHVAPWPETFSFTAYEALRAGAYIVTSAKSGNVAAAVRAMGRGVVLEHTDTIAGWLDSEACRELVARRREEVSTVAIKSEYSDMAVSLAREALNA